MMMKFSRKKDNRKEKPKKLKRQDKNKKEDQFVPICQPGHFDLKGLLESQGYNLKPKEPSLKASKLSPSLNEMLKNPLALAYFMEYLETKDSKPLVDFWLSVETFKVVFAERSTLNSYANKKSNFLKSQMGPCKDCQSNKEDSKLKDEILHRSMDKCSISSIKINNSTKDLSLPFNGFSEQDKDFNCSGACGNSQYHNETENKTIINEQERCLPTNNWEPFCVNVDKLNTERNIENYLGHRKNSYVAKRIMSKQTRNRSRSAVIDAVGIYARYMSLDADEPIHIPSQIRNDIEAGICKDPNNVCSECFLPAQKYIFSQLEPLYKEFLASTFGSKFKLYMLRETTIKFEDILYDDHALFYFMEYLDRENFREVVEFWLMAENFEQSINEKLKNGNYDVNESVEDAMSIYEKYFSMRSKHQLIADDKLRIVIENNICREDGPQSNCFCIPSAYAWTALKEIFYPRFLHTDAFVKLLESFLKNSIDSHKNDEVSSTTSSSDSRTETVELLSSAASFSDFLDKESDDLWYRPDAGRLAMGYVNPYGVFIPDMESTEFEDKTKETKSSVSRLGKAMKNLLSKETDEDKERLAWEKARSIIDDIQKQAKFNENR